ncbi:MAG: hypothetical protein J6Y23_13975 [Prevotella sp.]|nr:hypothetical protein [Prevotella sp.]
MRIISITPSPEPCAEAGWHASQYLLDGTVTRELVMALRPLGSMLLMDTLRQPFFKIESHHYMLKGLLGDHSIRVAVHRDHEEETNLIKQLLYNYETSS